METQSSNGPINELRGPIVYTCPTGMSISRLQVSLSTVSLCCVIFYETNVLMIQSTHTNWKEDREWSVECSQPIPYVALGECSWSEDANTLDNPMDFKVKQN